LGFGNGGNGKGGKKENEKNCLCPFKFAVIKKDLRSMIRDKKDFYDILFIRLSLFER
jgi:hypothetical protein